MDGSIKKILKYIVWFYVIPSIIWEVLVYFNDGVDPSKDNSNVEASKVIQDTMKSSGLREEDMGGLSGVGSAFQPADKRDRDQLNAEFKMMGMDTQIMEPTKRKPVNPNVKEYIDEDGVKIRIEME